MGPAARVPTEASSRSLQAHQGTRPGPRAFPQAFSQSSHLRDVVVPRSIHRNRSPKAMSAQMSGLPGLHLHASCYGGLA